MIGIIYALECDVVLSSRFFFIVGLLVLAAICLGQGRPNMVWMRGTHESLTHVEYTPDDSLLVTAGIDGTVKIHDASTGLLLRTINAVSVESMKISPSGEFIAIAGGIPLTPTVSLWRISNGRMAWSAPATQVNDLGISFSSDGELLAVYTNTTTLSVLRTDDASTVFSAPANGTPFKFIPGGTELVSGADVTNTWQVLNGATGALVRSFQTVGPGGAVVGPIAFNADGSEMAVAGFEDVITQNLGLLRCQTSTGALLQVHEGADKDDYVDVQWKGSLIFALALDDDEANVDTFTPSTSNRPVSSYSGNFGRSSMGVRNDAARIVLAGDDITFPTFFDRGVLTTFDVNGTVLSENMSPRQIASDVEFSPNGMVLASTSDDQVIRFWNADTGALIQTVNTPLQAHRKIRFSADGTLLALSRAARFTNSTRVLDIAAGTFKTVPHASNVLSVDAILNADKTQLFTADTDLRIRRWNYPAMTANGALNVGGGGFAGPSALALSPNGQVLAAAYGFKLSVINTSTFAITSTFDIDFAANELSISQDGLTVYIAGNGGVAAYTLATGAELWSQPVGPGNNFAGRLDPAGRFVLTGFGRVGANGEDGVIRFFRAPSGSAAKTYDVEAGLGQLATLGFDYSPDGLQFAFARGDSTIGVALNPYYSLPRIALFSAPTSMLGNTTGVGVVTLDRPAPRGGAVVNLFNANPNIVTIPTSVTVPYGQFRGVFNVVSPRVFTTDRTARLRAEYRGNSLSQTVLVRTPRIQRVLASPNPIAPNRNVRVTVILEAAAPSTGTVVNLTSSDPTVLPLPSTIMVPAGAMSANVVLGVGVPTSLPASITITATTAERVRTHTLTVQ
jgi:WD40 repeat protein